MAKLNYIRRYRFDDETNIALQKLGKKRSARSSSMYKSYARK